MVCTEHMPPSKSLLLNPEALASGCEQGSAARGQAEGRPCRGGLAKHKKGIAASGFKLAPGAETAKAMSETI